MTHCTRSLVRITPQPFLLTPREIFTSWLTGLGTFFFVSTQILGSPTSLLNISHSGRWVIEEERARTTSNKIICTFSDLLSWNLNSETSGSYMKYWTAHWWVSPLPIFRKCWDYLRLPKLRSVSRKPWLTKKPHKFLTLHRFMPSVTWLATDHFIPRHTGDPCLSHRRQGEDRTDFQKQTLPATFLKYFLFHLSPSKIFQFCFWHRKDQEI